VRLNNSAQFVAVVVVFLFGNVVGAGVWLVLYVCFQRNWPDTQSPLIYMTFGVVAVVCSICFIRGAIASLAGVQSAKRRGELRAYGSVKSH
jgi:hypothetical protein